MKVYSVIRREDNEPLKIKTYSTKKRAIMGFYAMLGEIIFDSLTYDKNDAIDYIKSVEYAKIIDGYPYYYTNTDELYIEETEIDEEFDNNDEEG